MTQPFDIDQAQLSWMRRRARQLQRYRRWLLWSPLAALPLAAAAAALSHPLLGGITMAMSSLLWLLCFSHNVESTESIGQRLQQSENKQRRPRP